MIPMFPVPTEGTPTASIMGGWLLSIPETSIHKELAWELITIMLKPEILSPVLAKFGLPTQISIGEGYQGFCNKRFYQPNAPSIPHPPTDSTRCVWFF